MENIIKDTLISYSGRINRYKTNAPSQYKDRKHQYLADETRMYSESYDKYSSDYVEAQVQGLEPNDPYGYTKVHIRLADAVTGTSAIGTVFDNYKMVEIAERQYTYIRRGAKIITMGNVWLAINPDNMSGIQGHAISERCDNTWNYLDFYGNVQHEPVCVDRLDMRGVDPDSQRSTMINTGYYAIKLQDNEQTRQLGNNSRLYVGRNCFRIAGYAEVSREFTYEEDTVNMIIFRAMLEEPNMAIDDLEHYVAGGRTFAWDISIADTPVIRTGESVKLKTISKRTSEEYSEEVKSTREHPVYYLWGSSDESVAKADNDGNITGIGEGEAVITATLYQNQDISADFNVKVAGDMSEPYIEFTSTTPKLLRVFEEVTLTAQYFENGEPVDYADIVFNFSGADEEAYTATVTQGNKVTIKCWSGSVYPLYVTAECNGVGTGFFVELEGV